MANQQDPRDPSGKDDVAQGDGPGKIGLTSSRQPELVSPSGINERDHGAADDKPMGGGSLNFDDDDMTHPRGNTARQGGTRDAQGGDSGKLGAPAEIQSDRIGTSDPDKNRQ
ncbi:serine/threonine protein kinase [Caenimonas aquaedulcis]|uniref:Serine/threonine protein kinase n=1 Tax=Caenimonas aquaedulcis TaxID=2793270 RepID=A0A931H859_9BURK|nr:serine/threonine protein kinase [Caenimonas aquaedulcis]MBG9390386.1 serine/threonine protein kinase [Caenimonas aquaedulcis]